MKKIVALLLLAMMSLPSLLAAETSGQKEPAKSSQDIGRYQLFQGTYTTIDLKYRQATSTHNAVFLIDTATGLVKRYVNRIDEDGRYIETWLPTNVVQQMAPAKGTAPHIEGKQ